jgi:hypothetical protein
LENFGRAAPKIFGGSWLGGGRLKANFFPAMAAPNKKIKTGSCGNSQAFLNKL